MLESKGETPVQGAPHWVRRRGDWLGEFDFLRLLVAFFSAPGWGFPDSMPPPIPVRVRQRR